MDLEEKARAQPHEMTDAEWRELLDEKTYRVTREGGTERAFTGELYTNKEAGTYACACCRAPLFESDTKYDSGSGWPSFHSARDDAPVEERVDRSHGMVRTEARCARCDAHLGHVFPDGPKPTGLRYCINSAALEFEPEK